MVIMHEFARHSSHKADDDFLHRCEALELGSRAVVEEVYYAIKGDSLQIRREGDDANVIF